MKKENGSEKYEVNMAHVDQNSSHGKILSQIKPNSKVLECGCATGYMTKWMKEELRCKVSVIEIDEAGFETAKAYAEDGFCGDLNKDEWASYFAGQQFDYILFADVLEHLADPLKVLTLAAGLLKSSGRIMISIPNIAHNDVILKLTEDSFDYTETGLLDGTHVHFWGRKNLEEFCQKAGLSIIQMDGTILPFKHTEQAYDSYAGKDSRILGGLADRALGEVYQYVFVCQKTEYVKRHKTAFVDLLPKKEESSFKKGTEVNVYSTVYFSEGTGFDGENSRSIVRTLNTALPGEIDMNIPLPASCTSVRIDPCEGVFCFVEELHIACDGKDLSPACVNGASVGSAYLFADRDPQFVCAVSKASNDEERNLSIRFQLSVFDAAKEKEIADFIKQIHERNVLADQMESLNEQLNSTRAELADSRSRNREIVSSTVFFADSDGFREYNAVVLNREIEKDEEAALALHFDVKVPAGCNMVRIDPCEGKYCSASNLQIIYDGKRLTGSPAKGFVLNEMIFFQGEDPQLLVELPDADGKMLHADMTIRLFSVRDLTLETLNRRIQEDDEQIDALSQIIAETNQSHSREKAALREEMEELQNSWEEKYSLLQQQVAEENEEKDVLMAEAARQLEEANSRMEEAASLIESLKAQIQTEQNSAQQLAARASYAEESYSVVSNSFFWKITKPGRAAMDGIKSVARKNERIYKGLRFVKWTFRYGPKGAVRRKREFAAMQAQAVQVANAAPAPVQRTVPIEADIKFSILVPLYNTPEQFLREMIESVTNQTYGNWQLCLADASDDAHGYVQTVCEQYAAADSRVCYKKLAENLMISGNSNAAAELADGDYIGLLDHDDLLSPYALEKNVIAIHETHADILYSDEDHLLLNGQHGNPFYKPDWSPDLLNTQMYICHFLVFKRELFTQVGGFRSPYDGSQDYDLMLRLSEKTTNIKHIPEILYSWRESPSSTALNADSKPYAQTAGLNAVNEHLHRKYGEKAFAQETENLFVYDARYPLPAKTKISIIIPMKDNWKLTDACIKSIVEKSTWKNYEILVLDNRSEESKTFKWFKTIVNLSPAIRVIKADMEFNWSKINNFGIRNGDGDVFIFLNNDTVVISPDWMERLAEKALREDTGVVGPLLLYEDGTIQHAGVVVGFGGWADHVFKGMPPVHFGAPYVSPMVTRNVLAVTGACMAVSKATLNKIGVFDETFIICGSDVELGIRAYEHGLFNVYDASVRLYHLESKSRDSYIPNQDYKRSYEVYGPYREGCDPFYNPNLDKNSTTPRIAEVPVSTPVQEPLPAAEPEAEVTEQGSTGEEADMKAIVRLKEALKTNPVTKGAYAAARNVVHSAVESLRVPSSSVAEVQPIRARKDEVTRKRLNLLTPSVDVKHVFGGIATALKFFEQLCEETGWEARIISVDAAVEKKTSVLSSRYVIVGSSEDSEEPYQVVPFNDRSAATIPVRRTDVFMATGWWTAYTIKDVLAWQKETFGLNQANPLVYLIQDFEPGFYPWSSRYLMADSTYRMDMPVYAVFNAKLLKEYFDRQGYSFKKSWYFNPVMNDKLAECLPADLTAEKKKQIIIYGRPGTPRNAFELACMALREFIAIHPGNKDWTFVSAGEEHAEIDLGEGAVLRSVGKLSLQDYAALMKETYAGISLMVSPHPSYPPLEMASFGVKTITNRFYNKDLHVFSDCITSVQNCSAYEIASWLDGICADYTPTVHWEINKDYVEGTNPFGEVIKELSSILKD